MWERVMAINLTGIFKLTRAVLPLMLDARRGSIVNVTSGAALKRSGAGNAYTTSKHAVIGLTRSAAFMYAQQGIRINVVAPGAVATGIQSTSNLSDYGRARLARFHALQESIGTAEELAAPITYLLSDDALNINGAVLSSDGGYSVQ
jgi:NAD(P)-dependent dehydrogenase (short-subunit alcohol dehydrogenase family)